MSEERKFEFDRYEGFNLRSAVFQALGAASMCWEKTPQGIFKSDEALAIGEALLAEIEAW